MTEKQKMKPVLTVLDEELKKAEKEHGDNSEQAIFVKCAITGVKNSGKGDFQIDPRCFSYQLCPDQYVGKISELGQKYYLRSVGNNIFDYSQASLTINKKIQLPDKNFLLILESSHIAEYYEQKKRKIYGEKRPSPAPAMGKFPGETGYNIVRPLEDNFFTYTESIREHHLILMNAIPFQCSLGVATGCFRDDVFDAAWKDELIGRSFFETRLGSLLHELAGKIVIVNACTKGKGRRHNVTELIKKVLRGYKSAKKAIELWEAPHPSSHWWFVEAYWKEIPIGR